MATVAEMLDHYRRLIADGYEPLWEAVSWTVIAPHTGTAVLAPLGDEVDVVPATSATELLETSGAAWDGYTGDGPRPDEFVWTVPRAGALGLFGTSSSIGSRKTLIALSRDGARVANVLWIEAIGLVTVGFAAPGVCELVDLGLLPVTHELTQAPTLADAIAQIQTVTNPIAEEAEHYQIGLTVVELISGVRLSTDIITARWPMHRLRLRDLPDDL